MSDVQPPKRRVVTIEELEAERESQYGTEVELWYVLTRVAGLMRPEKRGGHRCRVTRPPDLSKYGPGDRIKPLDFVKQVYSDRTGQE